VVILKLTKMMQRPMRAGSGPCRLGREPTLVELDAFDAFLATLLDQFALARHCRPSSDALGDIDLDGPVSLQSGGERHHC
jgi:hypothetical protein